MKRLSCVFVCGEESPYGFAHVAPIAHHFDLKAVVVADRQRWRKFREALAGGEVVEFRTAVDSLKHCITNIAGRSVSFVSRLRRRQRVRALGVPVLEFHDVNSAHAVQRIADFLPNVVLSAAYPQILKAPVLAIAPMGAINFHPSLLPLFRGAHPHYWALATGQVRSGITAHRMSLRIDDGDIVAQRPFDVAGLYYAELYERILENTPLLVQDVATFLSDPAAQAVKQDESRATTFRNDRDIHRRLDFGKLTADELLSRIRAGRAFVVHRGVRTVIERAEKVTENRNMTNSVRVGPGVIVDISRAGVTVSTIDETFLVIQEVRWSRKPQPFARWVAKFRIVIGERIV